MSKKAVLGPEFYAAIILILSQAITISLVPQEQVFIQENDIVVPEVSLGFPLAYFFGAVIILGIVLFLVPISILKIILKIVFISLFGWGTFILSALFLPVPVAAVLAVAVSLAFFFQPRVWMQNLLMMVALVSVGIVFGYLLLPWTAVAFMLIISVYDVLAVRFGYMLWMAKKMSTVDSLPAFIIPTRPAAWNLNLKGEGLKAVFDAKTGERDFSILGGGDIGFPLLLTVSVFFEYGLRGAITISAFSVLGLMAAYWIQARFLKGKPMPALPPIAIAGLIGLAIVYFIEM